MSLTYRIPLSPYSKIFYYEWLLAPESISYNIVIDQLLHGELDISRLKKALYNYVNDFVILNSHIQIYDNEPYWVPNNKIYKLDYSKNLEDDLQLSKYVKQNFDLHNGPLYRFKLIRYGHNIHRIILVLHHIIVDGSSGNDGVYNTISCYYNDIAYKNNVSHETQIQLITDMSESLNNKLRQNAHHYKDLWQKTLIDIEAVSFNFLTFSNNIGGEINHAKKPTQANIKEISFSYTK